MHGEINLKSGNWDIGFSNPDNAPAHSALFMMGISG
jgi:hypothetical protein